MKIFLNGEIVGRISEKTTLEDICPEEFRNLISELSEGEDLQLYFNSFGGDCFAALQICSMLKELSASGHRTTANITSIAASSASFIACSCDEIRLHAGAFMMLHLPWTMIQGNVIDLQKEISTLEQMKNSMMKIYRTKFDLSDEQLNDVLVRETWIDADNFAEFGLNCQIVDDGQPVKIAAMLRTKNFKNIPKGLIMDKEEEKKQDPETQVEETKEETKEETPAEEQTEETPAEETVEEEKKEENEDIDALKKRCAELETENEELKKKLEEAEKPVEDRISGIQSAMQKNFNAKINDFTNELQAKNQELTTIKDQVISLEAKLADCEKNCDELTSALRDKDSALESLNARVLSPADVKAEKSWRDLEGQDFRDYLKAHNNIIKITK